MSFRPMTGPRWRFLSNDPATGHRTVCEASGKLSPAHAKIIGHLLSDDLGTQLYVVAPGRTQRNPAPLGDHVSYPRWIVYGQNAVNLLATLSGKITAGQAKKTAKNIATWLGSPVIVRVERHGGAAGRTPNPKRRNPNTMTITKHESAEFSRAAQAMYARGQNDLGHLLSMTAAVLTVPQSQYDRAAEAYRAWLMFDEPKANPSRSLAAMTTRSNPRGGRRFAVGESVIYRGPAWWYEREGFTNDRGVSFPNTLAGANEQRYNEPANVVRKGVSNRYLVHSANDGRLAWADSSQLELPLANPRSRVANPTSRVGSARLAQEIAQESGLSYGMSVFDGKFYVGTDAELKKLGIVMSAMAGRKANPKGRKPDRETELAAQLVKELGFDAMAADVLSGAYSVARTFEALLAMPGLSESRKILVRTALTALTRGYGSTRETAAAGRAARAAQKEEMARAARHPANRANPRELSVPDKHQLRIARDTLKLHDAMVGVMGGMTKPEARAAILRLTGRAPVENPCSQRRHNPGCPCDPRCCSAVGDVCECRCRGAYHKSGQSRLARNPRARTWRVIDAAGRQFWQGEATDEGEALFMAERSAAGQADPPDPWMALQGNPSYRDPRTSGRGIGTPAVGSIKVGRTTYAIHAMPSKSAPYILAGVRGAVYGLIRYNNKPWLMYAVNLSSASGKTPRSLDGVSFAGETADQLTVFTGAGPAMNPSYRLSGTVEEIPDAPPVARRGPGRPRKVRLAPVELAAELDPVPFEVPAEAPGRELQAGDRVTVPYSGRASYFGRAATKTRESGIFEGYTYETGERLAFVRINRGHTVETHAFPVDQVRLHGKSFAEQAAAGRAGRPAKLARLTWKAHGSLAKAEAMLEQATAEHAATEAVAMELYPQHEAQPGRPRGRTAPASREYANARAKLRRLTERVELLGSVVRSLGGGGTVALGYGEATGTDPWATNRRRRIANPLRHNGPLQNARTVRGAKRKRNPRGSERERAVRTFKMWHEFAPHKITRMKGPDRLIPRTLVKLGDIRSIDYISDKYEGRPVTYTHKTDRPRPVLATDPDGQNLHIIGGRVKITGDGLIH